MNPPSRPRRPFGPGTLALMIVAGAVLGGAAGAVRSLAGDPPGAAGPALTAAPVSVAMALGFAVGLWWWRGIDEAAREAHKWAWWWGGSGGMAVGVILLLTLVSGDDGALPAGLRLGGLGAPDLVAAGMWTVLLAQIAGYGVAWAIWWLKHR